MTLKECSRDDEENFKIDELRRRLKYEGMSKEMYEDRTLFRRFLRARSLNVDAAETMLRNHLTFRKTYDVDNIKNWTPPQVLVEYFALNLLGFEKDGTPVVFLNYGKLDFRGVFKCATKTDILKFVIKFLETCLDKLKEVNSKLSNPVEKWKLIFNYEGLSLIYATHKPTIEFLAKVLIMYDNNYPERLKNAFLINGTLPLQIIWTIVKPLLSGPTVQKVKFLGRDTWKDELRQSVDPEVLPVFLGGDLTDPDGDPSCKSMVVMGGPIAQKYYKYKTGLTLQNKENAKKLTINRLSKSNVKLEILQPGSKIEWEFELKCRDIEFSLVYLGKREANPETVEEILPSQRFETDLESAIGMYLCNRPGIYALEFDNTYSWWHSKELYYKVTVVEPSEQNSSSVK